MTYSGAAYPSVSGQPPHRATQYALPAPMSATRASCSLRFRMMTTLSGSASAMTALSSFPRGQVFQYGFGTMHLRGRTPQRETRSELAKRRARNTRAFAPVHINRETFFTFPAPEALARLLAGSIRLAPVGAGRVDQVRNSLSLRLFSAFQRGSL